MCICKRGGLWSSLWLRLVGRDSEAHRARLLEGFGQHPDARRQRRLHLQNLVIAIRVQAQPVEALSLVSNGLRIACTKFVNAREVRKCICM